MSDQLASAAQEWFKKGTDAMNRQNWDFAVECFTSSIKMKPEVVLFRQTKHGCSRKMYDDNGSGARMASMKLMPIRGKIKKARGKKDWKAVATTAEDGLSVNPWDAQLFADLGEAAAELEWGEVAKHAYSSAVSLDKTNVAYNRGLGHVLRERGEYKLARECFKRIYDADPTDGEARSMMSQIDAESVMDRSYDKAESTQDAKVDKAPTNAYEEDRQARRGAKGANEAAAPGESEEMDMRAAIRKEPENVAHYMKLVAFLRTDRQLPQAIEILDKALEVSNNDVSIMEEKEDVELEIMRQKASDAVEKSRKNPDRERLKEKATTLKKELLAREIEVKSARIDNPNHKNNMKMRLEMAELYRRTKQFKLAIPLLQQATADSRLKEDALVALGECFVRTGKMDLGRRQFDKALETLNGKDKPDAFKSAHYFLGRMYEKTGKNDKAVDHYTEILSIDYDYRDVLKRSEDLQGGDEFEDFDDEDM